MSSIVPLQAIPNQTVSITLGDSSYAVSLRETNGVMSVDLARDNVVLLRGIRAVYGSPLIPYKYLEAGNFIFLTLDGNLPDYTLFGTTQFLLFYSASELGAIRGDT